MSNLKPGVSMRRCFVLREVEIPMEHLEKGEVFRLEPGSPEDAKNVGHHEYSLAKTDAKKLENDEWNCAVEAIERLQDIVGRRIKAIVKEDDGTITITLLGHDTKIRFSSRDDVDHDHIVVAKVIRKTRTVQIEESVEEIE